MLYLLCKLKSINFLFQFHDDEFTLRTKVGHACHCQLLEHGDHFSRTYGVNNWSLLNDSRYFHVIDGLPGDAMHDILEGVLPYVVKNILKVFIHEKKFFTLDELNNRVMLFDYGYYNDTNRPAAIKQQRLAANDNSLKQHGNNSIYIISFLRTSSSPFYVIYLFGAFLNTQSTFFPFLLF